MRAFYQLLIATSLLLFVACSQKTAAGNGGTTSETTNVITAKDTVAIYPVKNQSLYRWVIEADDDKTVSLIYMNPEISNTELNTPSNWNLSFTDKKGLEVIKELKALPYESFSATLTENKSISFVLKVVSDDLEIDLQSSLYLEENPVKTSSSSLPNSSSSSDSVTSSTTELSSNSSNVGLAWSTGVNRNLEIFYTGCSGAPQTSVPENCSVNYSIDCSLSLPVLCLVKNDSLRPNYAPENAVHLEAWGMGVYDISSPIKGTTLTSLEEGDALCETEFGTGAKMARNNFGKYIPEMDNLQYTGVDFAANAALYQNSVDGYWVYLQGGSTQWLNNLLSQFWVADLSNNQNCWAN